MFSTITSHLATRLLSSSRPSGALALQVMDFLFMFIAKNP